MNNYNPTGILLIILSAIVIIFPATAYSGEAVGFYDQGVSLLAYGNYSQAVGSFEQAIQREPGYFEAWDGKADALNRAHDYPLALAASNNSLQINPSYVKGWINRGQILYSLGFMYEDQFHDAKKADAYYNEQLAAFEKAVALDPENAEAWFNKGYALCGMGRCSEGILAFERVGELDPGYPYLEGNIKNARILAESQKPFYVKYGQWLVLLFLICAGSGWWIYAHKRRR
ncbi:MAG: tetratricopeptide repeat protein [Methanoregula sp.]|nr:MAG: tetratricopeptide repeat protein [Methanoregula sp.]